MANINRTITKSHKPTKQRTLSRSAIVLIFTLGPVLILLGLVGYNSCLYEADRQRFAIVKVSIETLARELQTRAISNEKWAVGASCVRAHFKYEKGEAGCLVNIGAALNLNSLDEVEQAIDLIDQVVSRSGMFKMEPAEGKMYPTVSNNKNTQQDTSVKNSHADRSYRENATGMRCNLGYSLSQVDNKPDSGDLKLDVSFTCASNARDTWFPRSDVQN